MSESDYRRIQARDDGTTEEAVAGIIENRIEQRIHEEQLERDAYIRKLIKSAEAAFEERDTRSIDDHLRELHWVLRTDGRLVGALDPRDGFLDAQDKLRWQEYERARGAYRRALEAGEDPDPPTLPRMQEFAIDVKLAKAIGAIGSYRDKSRYAPVYLEHLDEPGVRSLVDEDERTPIGRRRIGAASAFDLEEFTVEIPHADAEHILTIADPRQGKDSTGVTICGNLKDEHGYKWISLFDDGRNETPAISIPNDERSIQENLEELDQTPKAYDARVYVPAVGAPDELPANHELFTIGVDELTPGLIGQLAGVPAKGGSSRRIKAALDEVRAGSGSVDALIHRLEEFADETSAQITVTELKDDEDVDDAEAGDVQSYERTYEMGEDEYLRECAQTILMLSSEGLLRDAGAETNLDMQAILADRETVAVLNSNYLPPGLGYLKYLLVNLWASLIFELKEGDPNADGPTGADLPRVALECRELKKLAPSKPKEHPYPEQAKRLTQTMFDIASQGGSRRVMLVGSTQYFYDVYKAIRGNMPIKILLRSGDEKIRALENGGYDFTHDQVGYLKSFDPGWGMYVGHEGKKYPIQWRGARCGLGLGDLPLETRYGWAMGFRVHSSATGGTPRWTHDAAVYVDVDGTIEAAPPDRDEWYLLVEDLVESPDLLADPEAAVGTTLDADLVNLTLEERREYDLPRDLRPEPTPDLGEQRELRLVATEELASQQRDTAREKFDLHGILAEWVDLDRDRVRRIVSELRAIDEHEIAKYGDLSGLTGIPVSTISDDIGSGGPAARCVDKAEDVYQLEPVGKRAIDVSWERVFAHLDA